MPLKPSDKRISRRRFLRMAAGRALGLAGFPYLVSASALGKDSFVAPSERIVMGCIGLNGMGMVDMNAFLANEDVQVAAVCDVDARHRQRAGQVVQDYYSNRQEKTILHSCAAYNDFRELLARPDIDAVLIATPDHWHVPISIAAAKAGKDIYCEKPLCRTISEGRALCQAVKRYGRVFQTGSQLRSTRNVRFACELVRNGRIGKLHTIRTFLPPGRTLGPQPVMPVPEGFDYDMWLGPAPWVPYTEKRCHFNFRYVSDYAGGSLTDLGAHDNDIAQWGNATELTGPIEIEGQGEFPADGLFDTAVRFRVDYLYANGVRLICSTDPYPAGPGVRFEGDEGWIYVRWEIDAEPKSILTSKIGPNETRLYHSSDHHRNFLDCVRTRRCPIAPVEVGHRSATICHLGNVAMRLRRKLRWDPQEERFLNDEEANRLLSCSARSPWRLDQIVK